MQVPTKRFLVPLVVALAACGACSLVALAQSGGSITPTAGAPSSNPVACGDTFSYVLGASATAPTPPAGVAYAGPTWSWAAAGASELMIVQPDPNSPVATLYATISEAGYFTITMLATATWTGSDGSSVTLSDSD
jgi:hypothetical protein